MTLSGSVSCHVGMPSLTCADAAAQISGLGLQTTSSRPAICKRQKLVTNALVNWRYDDRIRVDCRHPIPVENGRARVIQARPNCRNSPTNSNWPTASQGPLLDQAHVARDTGRRAHAPVAPIGQICEETLGVHALPGLTVALAFLTCPGGFAGGRRMPTAAATPS